MAAVEVTITGALYDKTARTMRPVVLIGEASLTGVGVGGGPMPPGQGEPPQIWGGPIDPYPDHGLPGRPPQIWGPTDPRPTVPIYLPPGYPGGPTLPPGMTPPEAPPAGSAPTPVPPPEGSGGWPVQPITPPPYIVVSYPGVGPVIVPQPLTAQPK